MFTRFRPLVGITAGAAGFAAWNAFGTPAAAEAKPEPPQQGGAGKPGLDPNAWIAFPITEKQQLTHDTQRLRLALPDKDTVSGLTVASCLVTKADIGEEKPDGQGRKPVIRPYTPVSERNARGYIDLMVKGYPSGLMSKHLVGLKVGDTVECKGPIPKLDYKPNMKKKIGMVAGGSGMTPMLQVVYEIVNNPEDKTQVTFVYANKSEDDIICKSLLDDLAKKHSNFKVFYVVDQKKSWFWKGGVGHITADVLKEHMPPPSDDSLVLVCGPPPMYKAISGTKKSQKEQGEVTGALGELGYKSQGSDGSFQVYKF